MSISGIFCYRKNAGYRPFRVSNNCRFTRLEVDVSPPEPRHLVSYMYLSAWEESDNTLKLKLRPCQPVGCAVLLTSVELLLLSARAKLSWTYLFTISGYG